MNQKFTCDNLSQLPEVANDILNALGSNSIVLIRGEMGAGKTTLISAMSVAMGVRDAVSSPTFSLVNEYEDRDGKPIYHFDFYRIDDEEEALDMGVFEYFDSGALCFVEWPEKIESLWPESPLILDVSTDGAKRTYHLHN